MKANHHSERNARQRVSSPAPLQARPFGPTPDSWRPDVAGPASSPPPSHSFARTTSPKPVVQRKTIWDGTKWVVVPDEDTQDLEKRAYYEAVEALTAERGEDSFPDIDYKPSVLRLIAHMIRTGSDLAGFQWEPHVSVAVHEKRLTIALNTTSLEGGAKTYRHSHATLGAAAEAALECCERISQQIRQDLGGLEGTPRNEALVKLRAFSWAANCQLIATHANAVSINDSGADPTEAVKHSSQNQDYSALHGEMRTLRRQVFGPSAHPEGQASPFRISGTLAPCLDCAAEMGGGHPGGHGTRMVDYLRRHRIKPYSEPTHGVGYRNWEGPVPQHEHHPAAPSEPVTPEPRFKRAQDVRPAQESRIENPVDVGALAAIPGWEATLRDAITRHLRVETEGERFWRENPDAASLMRLYLEHDDWKATQFISYLKLNPGKFAAASGGRLTGGKVSKAFKLLNARGITRFDDNADEEQKGLRPGGNWAAALADLPPG